MTSANEAPALGLTHYSSEDTGLGQRGPASKSIVVPYGFWLFILADMVLFSALFATYASLVRATRVLGPRPRRRAGHKPGVPPQPGCRRADGAAGLELRLRPRDDH